MEENNSQAPAALASSAAEVPKQSNNKNVIIAVLCILVLGLGGVIAYLLLNKESPVDANDPAQPAISEPVRKDLRNKVAYLLDVDPVSLDKNEARHNIYNLVEGLLDNGLTTDNKQFIAIDPIEGKQMYYLSDSVVQSIYAREKEKYRELVDVTIGDIRELYYWDADEVAANYKDLFGEEMPLDTIEVMCPHYQYDSNAKIYYIGVVGGCGGGGPVEDIYYVGGYYKENSSKAYVDVYVGSLAPVSEDDMETFVVSNDSYTHRDSYKQVKTIKESEAENYHITDETKGDFTQYRFMFEGVNDDFHFVEIQKV